VATGASPDTAENSQEPFFNARLPIQVMAFLEHGAGQIPDEGAAPDSWILSETRPAKPIPDTWENICPLPLLQGRSRALSQHRDEQANSLWIASLWVIGTAIATALTPPEDAPEVSSARGPGRRNGSSA
jgi:hypothetical protein